MASAVLASRNEPCWGEGNVYMRKYTNSNNPHLQYNPNPNPSSTPNSNPNRQIHDLASKNHGWQSGEPQKQTTAPPAVSDVLSSLNRRTGTWVDWIESIQRVTFDLSSYTRKNLKNLKKNLVVELEQVRSLRNRIESTEFKSRSRCPSSQFSEKFGVRNPQTLVRPPPLQHNYAAESPTGAASSKQTPNANEAQDYPSTDIGTAKAKNGPSGKKMSGKKRRFSTISSRIPKRPTVEPVPEKVMKSFMRKCGQFLNKLMKHQHGWVFLAPVEVEKLKLHDYYTIIKHPMDLGTVKEKLGRGAYAEPLDFASDVRLTFNNAILYNPKGDDVHRMAEVLLSLFDDMFNPAYKNFEDQRRRLLAVEDVQKFWSKQQSWAPPSAVESVRRPDKVQPQAKISDTMPELSTYPTPEPVKIDQPDTMPEQPTYSTPEPVKIDQPDAPSSAPRMSSGRLPKPKARDPNKREMTFEEQMNLGESIHNLPEEKMDQLIQIIKKNNRLTDDVDEIELDIESLDKETQWELDRFVSAYKKMLIKSQRNNNQVSAPQVYNKSPVMATPEAVQKNKNVEMGEEDVNIGDEIPMCNYPPAQKNKKVEMGEEDVDIGDEIPMCNYPPVEIEKDRSSGSSSSGSSGSSSSESDSGSSSGSDSDEDSVQSPYVEYVEPPRT